MVTMKRHTFSTVLQFTIFFKRIHSLWMILVCQTTSCILKTYFALYPHTCNAGSPMEPFVKALCQPQAYPHPTGTIEVVETHISWVFLTELWAYKVKKALGAWISRLFDP